MTAAMTAAVSHWMRRWAGALLCLAMALSWQASHAAELKWRSRAFQIVASDKSLPDFLRELGASQGTTTVVDPKVAGVISGKFSGAARTILDSVCATYGLTWYYDGSFLYIDLASDARSEVLSISAGAAERIAQTIVALKISDNRYPLSISENEGSVFVSGPKRYVEMVRQAVKLADQRASMADYSEIRLFPLKYAWAADFRINRQGRDTVIPGVVSVLRSLYGRGGHQAGGGGAGVDAPFRVGPSRQIQLRSGESVSAPKVEMPMIGAAPVDGGAVSFSGRDTLPQFHADTRMNAVLVRDTPERMAQYARVIESMDVRPRLIEIEVTIMDISSDTLDSLGVDWRLHGRHGDVQVGRGSGAPLTWNNGTTETGQTGAVPPVGGVFSAAIGNDVRNYLLARVSALSQTGQANFVARPKVMTLDNSEAVLENLHEIYVRVDGFQDAALFSITAGTAVRVTPLIVDESASRSVMLSIDIEDGDLNQATVDRIPIVRRRTVNTQALVSEGTSLLIAGYSAEETRNAVTGVPLLSDVPVLGKLFQYTEKKAVNLERFYLLTPRMVVPGTQADAPVQEHRP